MSAGRAFGTARRMRDPRWRWLAGALEEIYGAMGRGDQVTSLTVAFEDPDFARVAYTMAPGDQQVGRFVCLDPDAADEAFDRAFADVTPDDTPELAGGDVP